MVRYRFWRFCKWLHLGDFFYRRREVPDTETTSNHTQTDSMWRWSWGTERMLLRSARESLDRLVKGPDQSVPFDEEELDIYGFNRSD